MRPAATARAPPPLTALLANASAVPASAARTARSSTSGALFAKPASRAGAQCTTARLRGRHLLARAPGYRRGRQLRTGRRALREGRMLRSRWHGAGSRRRSPRRVAVSPDRGRAHVGINAARIRGPSSDCRSARTASRRRQRSTRPTGRAADHSRSPGRQPGQRDDRPTAGAAWPATESRRRASTPIPAAPAAAARSRGRSH